ncbi:MAG: Gfo/Idh/MocA family protein, partial [Planctomycetota bacterium]
MSAFSRRRFLQYGAAALGATFAPAVLSGLYGCSAQPRRASLRPGDAPIRGAFIGLGGMATSDVRNFLRVGVQPMAVCDIDLQRGAKSIDKARKANPDVRVYQDYRELFAAEANNLDLVVVSTPDHMHAPISLHALSLGLHVYCQKPLTRTVWESRQVALMAEHTGAVTQMGNQRTAPEPFRHLIDVLRSDVLGEVNEMHMWTNRPVWPQGRNFPDWTNDVPAHVDWDLWRGPTGPRAFADGAYHPFNWRAWPAYGAGAIGDIAVHAFPVPYYAYNLRAPRMVVADNYGEVLKDSFPSKSTIRFSFDALGDQKAIDLVWYEGGNSERGAVGGNLPPAEVVPSVVPATFGDSWIGNMAGSLIVGSKGVMLDRSGVGIGACFAAHGEDKMLSISKHPLTKDVPQVTPRHSGDHWQDVVDAIRGTAPMP